MAENAALGKAFTDIETSSFCGQMAIILQSGISSIEGLQIMLEDAADAQEKKIMESLIETSQMTGSLYTALSESGLFPAYMLQMVQIGEETGTLDEVMGALSEHYEREDTIQKTVRSSLTFPMIMIGMMVVVIIVMLVKVLPIFNQVFVQLGSEMTGFSRGLLNLGNAISTYSAVLVVVLAIVVIFGLYAVKTANGRKMMANIGRSFGPTKKIYEQIASCRFASGMALTLRSGLNPERSFELVRKLNDDPDFDKKLDQIQDMINEGEDMSEALHKAGVFTGVYARMASVGGKTGSLDQVMAQIADRYEDDINARISGVLSVLEPALVIVLSLIVGVILLSVMLPLMGIMSSL